MLCATVLLWVASGLTREPRLHQVFSSKLRRGSNRRAYGVTVVHGVLVLCGEVIRIFLPWSCYGGESIYVFFPHSALVKGFKF